MIARDRRGVASERLPAAAAVARYHALSGAPTNGKNTGPTAIEEIVRRAKAGDRPAVEALVETGRHVGRGLANVASAFNPKRIYVGGEMTAAWELLEKPIREALVAGTLTEVTASTPVYADPNPAEYRLLGAVALVAAPSFAAPRVG